ncbi:MAG: 50S ribosomal protein L1 [Parcubacteria group bacterium ADurb.Bin326]|nr:MAG: 50S ribosomal protein L1 [Parcubacteria group bacterium ADurb.Bin326]
MKKVEHKPSKRFLEAKSLVEKDKSYPIAEAVELAKKTSTVKFDAGLEVHVKLGINPKKTDQQVRASVSLPNGTGKSVKVAVVSTNGDQIKAGKAAGAEVAGEQDLIDEIKAGKINFDVLVATPEVMKLLAPIAKVLGPKGLMPNPKDGTVTGNVAEAVANLKKGKVSYKNDDSGNLHVMIGKLSFEDGKLVENFQALMDSITKAKPAAAKGTFIKNVSVASSMGPGIKITL